MYRNPLPVRTGDLPPLSPFNVPLTPFCRVINTKIMLACSCFIVILRFSYILKFFRTHKNQIFEVDLLTGNSV